MGADIVVVGAGAAGLFAARSAALQGASVLLLEKTSRIGTKILISGGGKCNIAHAGPLEDVIGAFDKREALFIRPSCYRMRNDQIISIFEDRGLRLQARPNGRVFPVDGTAKDVLNILVQEIASLNVQICLNTAVDEIFVSEGAIKGVGVKLTGNPLPFSGPRSPVGFGAKVLLQEALRHTSHEGRPWDGPSKIECKRLIVCCGGASYPNSGTTGDGWKWARQLGHSVVKPRAALAPIYLETHGAVPAGVSLQRCRLVARVQGKKAAEEGGDLLFTHQGISGPAALEISRKVALLCERDPVGLEVDLRPDFSLEKLQLNLKNDIDREGSQTLSRWLVSYMWHSMLGNILELLEIEGSKPIQRLSKREKNLILETMKAWPIGTVKTVPLEKGEVTAGGIDLSEVDPKTMRSKLVPGLYLAGEILDVAGPVGGYNLQAAFATGHVAGETAALDALAIIR